MIQINLLPAEYRKTESTPVARFVAIMAGAVLLTTGLVTYGFVHYSKLRAAREVREATEAEFRNKKAQADVSLSLQQEIQAFEARRKTIQDVASLRILWSRKLDELMDILHARGDKTNYFVWLNGLKVAPARDAARRGEPSSGGSASFSGYSESIEFSKVTNLRNAIRKDPFFEDFKAITLPVFEEQRWEDGKEPSAAGKFHFDLTLKPLGWRRAEKKK
ncbi:MAG: PilN domain-containing protein [Planctomycetota bacterium]